MTPNQFRTQCAICLGVLLFRGALMSKLFLIGLAGFTGTLSRYWMSGVIAKRYGEIFPMGTLVVNLVGCFLVGLLFYLLDQRFLVNQTARTVVLIGFMGGFTTFCSFGLQTFTLLQDREFGLAVLNVTASNVIGLLLVWAGYTLARII
jgi:fluoride exporter